MRREADIVGGLADLAVWAENGVVNNALALHALRHQHAVILIEPLGVGEGKFVVSGHQG